MNISALQTNQPGIQQQQKPVAPEPQNLQETQSLNLGEDIVEISDLETAQAEAGTSPGGGKPNPPDPGGEDDTPPSGSLLDITG